MNKKISFPIAIIIIVVCAVLVGGAVLWQTISQKNKFSEPPINENKIIPPEQNVSSEEIEEMKGFIKEWASLSHSDLETSFLMMSKLSEKRGASLIALRDMLLNGSSREKIFACSLLGEMRDDNSIESLIRAVDDNDVKIYAITSLRELNATEAADKIRQQIEKNENKVILKVSLAALGILGNSSDIPLLKKYLSGLDEDIKVTAAGALAMLGNYEGEEILIAATNFNKDNPGLSKEATYSLGFVKTLKARNKLQEILDDPNGRWKTHAQIGIYQQGLLDKTPEDQLIILKEAVYNKNDMVSEWALEKTADLNTPEATEFLEEVALEPSRAGLMARYLLKARGIE